MQAAHIALIAFRCVGRFLNRAMGLKSAFTGTTPQRHSALNPCINFMVEPSARVFADRNAREIPLGYLAVYS